MSCPGYRIALIGAVAAALLRPALAEPPKFAVDPAWPQTLPANWIIGTIGGIFVDAQDHIWINQRPSSLDAREKRASTATNVICCVPAPPVIEFDQAGQLVQGWGGDGPAYTFGNPWQCMPLRNGGLVLVRDPSHDRWPIFRKDGTFGREISVLKESAPGTIGSIAKWPDAAESYLLVVDAPNGQFHAINRADGSLMASYGRVGHQLGEFYNLHFIGIDSKGNVYSAEVQGKRVQKFRNLGGL